MSKSVTQLIELAKVELEAGRTAKGTRLLKEAFEQAAKLDKPAIAPDVKSAIQHSTLVGELRAIYRLGGMPARRS